MPCPRDRDRRAEIEAERARFAEAVAVSARSSCASSKTRPRRCPARRPTRSAILLDAHLQMLADSACCAASTSASPASGINAERAVQVEIDEIGEIFAAIDDAYLAARIDDIREVGDRLIRNLTKTPYAAFSRICRRARSSSPRKSRPADTALMDPAHDRRLRRRASAAPRAIPRSWRARWACRRCSASPALLGWSGPATQLIIDGDRGPRLVVRRRRRIAEYHAPARGVHARPAPAGAAAAPAGGDPRRHRDRARSQSRAAASSSSTALATGAEGIGLLRTEFMFMNRDDLPERGRAVRALRELVTRHGRQAGDRCARSTSAATSWPAALAGHARPTAPTRRSACAPSACRWERRLLDTQLARHAARRASTARCASCCRWSRRSPRSRQLREAIWSRSRAG